MAIIQYPVTGSGCSGVSSGGPGPLRALRILNVFVFLSVLFPIQIYKSPITPAFHTITGSMDLIPVVFHVSYFYLYTAEIKYFQFVFDRQVVQMFRIQQRPFANTDTRVVGGASCESHQESVRCASSKLS